MKKIENIRKSIKKPLSTTPLNYETRNNLPKPYVYFTIVNNGIGNNVISLFEEIGCSAQVILSGEGTASAQMRAVLNIENNKKDIVISFVRESSLEDIKKELESFFLAAKKNKGIGFAVPMTSIEGVRIYKFLMRTL